MFYYLEKIDINEELVRLDSHINFFNDTLKNKSVEKGNLDLYVKKWVEK